MEVPVNIPLLDKNDEKAVSDCVKSGWISSQGPYIEKFENSFASYVGINHAIAVSNGSGALDIAIEALKIPRGSEVIIPDFTIFSPAISVLRAGLTPVFVDVNINTWNSDVNHILDAITEKTAAILIVHTYGLTVDICQIKSKLNGRNIRIIEDCAEAHGIRKKNGLMIGTESDVSTFSFYPNKLITTGEGGMILTDDEQIAKNLRELRNIGFSEDLPRYQHSWLGYNYRMTSFQAALGISQLQKIDHHLDIKRSIGNFYNEEFSCFVDNGIKLPLSHENGVENSYWVYGLVLRSNEEREKLKRFLSAKGIGHRDFFFPLHLQPCLKDYFVRAEGELKNSKQLSERGLYIPTGLGMSQSQLKYVASNVKEYFKRGISV